MIVVTPVLGLPSLTPLEPLQKVLFYEIKVVLYYPVTQFSNFRRTLLNFSSQLK